MFLEFFERNEITNIQNLINSQKIWRIIAEVQNEWTYEVVFKKNLIFILMHLSFIYKGIKWTSKNWWAHKPAMPSLKIKLFKRLRMMQIDKMC